MYLLNGCSFSIWTGYNELILFPCSPIKYWSKNTSSQTRCKHNFCPSTRTRILSHHYYSFNTCRYGISDLFMYCYAVKEEMKNSRWLVEWNLRLIRSATGQAKLATSVELSVSFCMSIKVTKHSISKCWLGNFFQNSSSNLWKLRLSPSSKRKTTLICCSSVYKPPTASCIIMRNTTVHKKSADTQTDRQTNMENVEKT